MHHHFRLAHPLFVGLLVYGTAAFAQEATEMPPPAEAAAPASAAPATPESGSVQASEETPVVAAAAAKPVDSGRVGFAARWRFVSVPGWFLGLFAEKNVPLSTFNCFAAEGFWRKHDKDDRNRTWEIVVSAGYQNMTPSDGFWLGRGKQLTQDTDLVQVRGLGLITFDAAYVLRQYFSPYFGIHYGAGLGLGVVRGKVLRTSATCDQATQQCHVEIRQPNPPVSCGHVGEPACTEADLTKSQGTSDNGPGDPHRFQETGVPSAIPIINLLVGLDFPVPLPDKSNLEFRLEGGFYDAFFVGLTMGYVLK
jgi:hypothetical protein